MAAPPKSERRAEIVISFRDLKDLINLPRPNDIVGVLAAADDGVLVIAVDGPDMPLHEPGTPLSRRGLSFRKTPDWATTLDRDELERDE